MLGLPYYHTYRSRRSEPGFPDVVIVSRPKVIFAELKAETGVVSLAQQSWLDALGGCNKIETYLWRPDDWPEIAMALEKTE